MPSQPPVLGSVPLQTPRSPGAINLLLADLTDADIVSIINGGAPSAQTTLGILKEFFIDGGFASSVENIEDLAALEGNHLKGTVIVRGYATDADGGGGIYHYD